MGGGATTTTRRGTGLSTRVVAALAVALLALAAAAVYAAVRQPTAELTTAEVAARFGERRMVFLDGRICREDGYGDPQAQRGMAMLEKAVLTDSTSGSTSCGTEWDIDTANGLILEGTEEIGEDRGMRVVHGGGMTLARTYLRYADRTVRGEELLPVADELRERLAFFQSNGVLWHGSDIGLFDVDVEDERPSLDGTENHQLQQIAVGMLLAEIFAGESYGGRPVSDYGDFYRRAFFSYLSRGGEESKFLADMPDREKDSIAYSHTYLGDLWTIRDHGPDAVVRRHAEILIDRMLADYAEDAVKGLYTGYSGRHYHRDHVGGQATHIHGYLLFDNLGFAPSPEELAELSGWGAWLHMALVTSDYNPSNPRFPWAVIDLARNKEDGYLVREGRRLAANWVEDDLALGFQVGGLSPHDSHQGGFYVNTSTDHRMGLHVAPYVTSPYSDEEQQIEEGAFLHKNRPYTRGSGVVSRRVAIVRTEHVPLVSAADRYPEELPVHLWVQNEPDHAFEDIEQADGWLFLEAESAHEDRDVYLAVTAPVDGWRPAGESQQGLVFELPDPDEGYTVWEVSTSDQHDSFADFRRDVLDNPLRVTDERITYRSSALGTSLVYDRRDHRSHLIDGSPVDWNEFAHGVHNPYIRNPHGSHRMTITKGGFTAQYDWDRDDDGDFDELPFKVVNNGRDARASG